MERIAEKYVKTVLGVGQHDPDFVDAYYGPAEWRKAAATEGLTLEILRQHAAEIIDSLCDMTIPVGDQLILLRHQYIYKQAVAVAARIDILQGKKMNFDEESSALYDAVAPHLPESWFEETLAAVSALLPGSGSLHERYDSFRVNFVVPTAKLDAVFNTAILECRKRTQQKIELPPGENFRVEYVTDKPWSAYNWYKGGFQSVIEVNTDFPIYIDRVIDLAAHEGYPGHHVYNALLEQHLVKQRNWMEFTVYPLFSPQSLIAEGTANYGIDVAFPGAERIAYEKDVLFPAAGLNAADTELYYRIHGLLEKLNYASNEAARLYLEGRIGAEECAEWLTRNSLMAPDRARQRVRFIEKYRSYVINYNLGKDMVAKFIESRGGTSDKPEKRWQEFQKLISSPRLPSGIRIEE